MAFLPIRGIALAGLILSLSGCSGMYVGADKGLAHVGAVKRGDNLYDVVYLGNDATTPDQRRDMTLLQSAELCKARGFPYFKASDTQTWSTFTPGAANEAPKVTLQVSCFQTNDAAAVTYGTDQVIDRLKASYNIN